MNGTEDGNGTRMEDGDVYVALGAHRVKPCTTTINAFQSWHFYNSEKR